VEDFVIAHCVVSEKLKFSSGYVFTRNSRTMSEKSYSFRDGGCGCSAIASNDSVGCDCDTDAELVHRLMKRHCLLTASTSSASCNLYVPQKMKMSNNSVKHIITF